MSLIAPFLGTTACSAQVYFRDKPVSKKCANHTFYVWRSVWVSKNRVASTDCVKCKNIVQDQILKFKTSDPRFLQCYHSQSDPIWFYMFCTQHCFICLPTDSTVSEDAGIELRTVASTVDYQTL